MSTRLPAPGLTRSRLLARDALGMTTVALGSGATAATARATPALESDCASVRLLIASELLAIDVVSNAPATPELPAALPLDAATAALTPFES
jgi:hypothetical protein